MPPGNARFLAADLLAQAEHGPDSVVGVVTHSKRLFKDIQVELKEQLAETPRREIATKALKRAGFILRTKSMKDSIAIVNDWAPEHLILVAKDEDKWLDQVRTAGAIYVGKLLGGCGGRLPRRPKSHLADRRIGEIILRASSRPVSAPCECCAHGSGCRKKIAKSG